jgi:hypothetical protein
MSEELETILRLVADGTLTPEQAAPIIDALSAAERAPRTMDAGPRAGDAPVADGGRHLRIRVTERGRQVVNLRIPLAFAEMATRMVPGIDEEGWGRIRHAVATNVVGPILDVEDPDGDGVLISVE